MREVDIGALVADPEFQAAAHRALFAAAGGAEGEEAPAELYATLYRLLFGAALLMDSVPTMGGQRDIRIAADDVRETVKTMLRALDAIKKREGRPLLELMGATDAPPASAH